MKASRFLLKDDLEQTLSECVEDILREERVVEFGFVEGNVSLRVDDIIYIETNKHKNVFCTVGRHTASIRRWMSIFKKVIIFSLVAVGHIVDTHIIGEGSAVTLPQNNFCGLVSKNAIEERITAIMKSLFSAGFFPGLSLFLGAGFGTGLESPRASDSSNT